MIVGGYTMDLYCENQDQCRGQLVGTIIGTSLQDARRIARSKGWTVSTRKGGAGTAHCPRCVKASKKAGESVAAKPSPMAKMNLSWVDSAWKQKPALRALSEWREAIPMLDAATQVQIAMVQQS